MLTKLRSINFEDLPGGGSIGVWDMTPGVVTGVTITDGGSGYTSVPAVSFTGGGGTGAAAVATVAGGQVTGITLTARGSGYVSAPDFVITGGGGVDATATASFDAGVVYPIGADIGFSYEVQNAQAYGGLTPKNGQIVSFYPDLNSIVIDALTEQPVPASTVGTAGGVASLDGAGKVPSAQLPSYVDDVVEYADFASLPVSGETGKIYITLADDKSWRWSGSAYVDITGGMMPVADQTLVGNISGGVAVPVALSKGQVQTLLRQNAAFVSMSEGATYVVAAGTSSLQLTHGTAKTNLTVDCSALEVGDPPFLIHTNLAVRNLTLLATGFGSVSPYRTFLNANSTVAVSKTANATLAISYLPGPWLEEVRENSGIHNTRSLRAIRVPNTAVQGNDVDLAFGLRGNGAFSLAVPDGAVAGGNKRGLYAVDLQLARNAATQIASGNYSILLSGERCTASASHTGAGGYTCTVSGAYSFAYGYNLTIAGTYSQAFGGRNTINASAYAATALGFGGVLGGGYTVGCGDNYRDRDMSGLLLLAANNGSGEPGMRQNHLRVLKRTTTDATTAYLSWTGADGTTSQYVLDAGRIATVRVRVVAVNSARTAHAVWEGTVVVQRKTTAATTTVLLDTIAQISSSGTGNTWVVAAAADTTNGLLSLNITGEAATTIRWTADVDTLESL